MTPLQTRVSLLETCATDFPTAPKHFNSRPPRVVLLGPTSRELLVCETYISVGPGGEYPLSYLCKIFSLIFLGQFVLRDHTSIKYSSLLHLERQKPTDPEGTSGGLVPLLQPHPSPVTAFDHFLTPTNVPGPPSPRPSNRPLEETPRDGTPSDTGSIGLPSLLEKKTTNTFCSGSVKPTGLLPCQGTQVPLVPPLPTRTLIKYRKKSWESKQSTYRTN